MKNLERLKKMEEGFNSVLQAEKEKQEEIRSKLKKVKSEKIKIGAIAKF